MEIPMIAIVLQQAAATWRERITHAELMEAQSVVWSGCSQMQAIQFLKDLYKESGMNAEAALAKAKGAVDRVIDEESTFAESLLKDTLINDVIDFMKNLYQEAGMSEKAALKRARDLVGKLVASGCEIVKC